MHFVLCLLILVACSPKEKLLENPLTVDRLFSEPALSGASVIQPRLSPDGKTLTFLQGKSENDRVLDLWAMDSDGRNQRQLIDSEVLHAQIEDGELSTEEKAQRERKRISHDGIINYFWSHDSKKILIPYKGGLFLYDLELGLNLLSSEPCFDPKLSPTSRLVSCIRNYNLVVIDTQTKKTRQLTKKGSELQPIGIAEFIAQEEMGRYRGYWWSPDESHIAFTQVDNSVVDTVKRLEFYPKGLEVVEQRYPYAGSQNAKVELLTVHLASLTIQKLSQPQEIKDSYIPHVQWLPDKKNLRLSYQIQSRDQKKLELWLYSIKEQRSQKILDEQDSAWVSVNHELKFNKDGSKAVWLSERSGYPQLHWLDLQSRQLEGLTRGPWSVKSVHKVDGSFVYFSANKESPLENHLYRVSLSPPHDLQRLTDKAGWHQITMAEEGLAYLDSHSTRDQPPQIRLYSDEGKAGVVVKPNQVDSTHPLYSYQKDFGEWQLRVFKGKGYELYYRVLLPTHFNKQKLYPLIQFVYGGPGVQVVKNAWQGDSKLFQQILAQQGFIVLEVDNRGTPGRGRDFERAFHKALGSVDVQDQSEVLEHVLLHNKFIDPLRVGVYGHSYGGYLTLMLMMQKSDLYKVGVAGAPVVDWSLYDTHYTERYLGRPQEGENLYKNANVLNYSEKLKGDLLLIHGMADDNVLYSHSTLLYQKLQSLTKPFDIMVYPGSKHSLRESRDVQKHHMESILRYFQKNL